MSESNDRCLSEHKSSGPRRNRRKCAKSDYFLKSNKQMKEASADEGQGYNEYESDDQQSVGQKSGSSALRSVKSLRKKNI